MRICLLCVGKSSTKHLEPALQEYLQRLKPFSNVSIEVIPSSDTDSESSQLLKRLDGQDVVVLLDERGQEWSTPELAERIERWQNQGTKSVVMVVGGAFGVSQAVRDRADMVWSLSQLVFPHELVRLIVIEQLYRAYDVLRGGKYHHD